MIDINKLHKMTFEEDKIYLEQNGYMQDDVKTSVQMITQAFFCAKKVPVSYLI